MTEIEEILMWWIWLTKLMWLMTLWLNWMRLMIVTNVIDVIGMIDLITFSVFLSATKRQFESDFLHSIKSFLAKIIILKSRKKNLRYLDTEYSGPSPESLLNVNRPSSDFRSATVSCAEEENGGDGGGPTVSTVTTSGTTAMTTFSELVTTSRSRIFSSSSCTEEAVNTDVDTGRKGSELTIPVMTISDSGVTISVMTISGSVVTTSWVVTTWLCAFSCTDEEECDESDTGEWGCSVITPTSTWMCVDFSWLEEVDADDGSCFGNGADERRSGRPLISKIFSNEITQTTDTHTHTHTHTHTIINTHAHIHTRLHVQAHT